MFLQGVTECVGFDLEVGASLIQGAQSIKRSLDFGRNRIAQFWNRSWKLIQLRKEIIQSFFWHVSQGRETRDFLIM